MRLHLVGIGDSVINFCEKYICGDNNSSSDSSKTKREERTQASYVRDYINPKLCQVLWYKILWDYQENVGYTIDRLWRKQGCLERKIRELEI